MSSQMALPLDWTGGARDFLVSTANQDAVRHMEHSSTWPVRATVLVGPTRSGKSLLARLFEEATGGAVIDDAETAGDEHLFHAWNRAHDYRRPLLMVSAHRPADWAVTLPDLRSRLGAVPVVEIGPPDDALAEALIERGFARRGTIVAEGLPRWLMARTERSYAALETLVARLDEAALAQKRRISIAFARDYLADGDMAYLPGFAPRHLQQQ